MGRDAAAARGAVAAEGGGVGAAARGGPAGDRGSGVCASDVFMFKLFFWLENVVVRELSWCETTLTPPPPQTAPLYTNSSPPSRWRASSRQGSWPLWRGSAAALPQVGEDSLQPVETTARLLERALALLEIGRASCRERVSTSV